MKHVTAVLSVLLLLALAGVALAQGEPAPGPDPSVDPGAFWDALRSAYGSSPLLGIVLALWGLSRVVFKFQDVIPFDLSTPRRRALLVGAMGSLGTAAVALATGLNPLSTVLSLAAALVALYLNAEPKKTPA